MLFWIYTERRLIVAWKISVDRRVRGGAHFILSDGVCNLVSPTENWAISHSYLIIFGNLINHSDSLEIINVLKRILDRSTYLVTTDINKPCFLKSIYDESTRTYIAMLYCGLQIRLCTQVLFLHSCVFISQGCAFCRSELLTKIILDQTANCVAAKSSRNAMNWTKRLRISERHWRYDCKEILLINLYGCN